MFAGPYRVPRRLWPVAFVLVVCHGAFAVESPHQRSYFDAGLKAFQRGAMEEAIANWTDAARSAEAAGRAAERVTALEHLARAYASLGRHGQAIQTLRSALSSAEALSEPAVIPVLAALGNVHVAAGQPGIAEPYLQRSLGLARRYRDIGRTGAILNDLGNLYAGQNKHAEAVAAYSESASLAQSAGLHLLAARGLGNEANALRRQGRQQEAEAALHKAWKEVQLAPPAHETVLTWIQLGVGFRELGIAAPHADARLVLHAANALNEAGTMAEQIGDSRGASHAWGNLGALYEAEGRYQEALQLSRKAVFHAQQVNAPESLYRWQWQVARALKQVGTMDQAIGSYRRAVHTLQSIRQEFPIAADPASSFRDTVGRVYFELVDLLLQRAGSLPDSAQVAAHLVEARDTVELFKVAELRDYFRDDCVDAALATATKLDAVSPTAAVIYPILLPDRTELLVSLPTGLKRFSLPVNAIALTQEARQLRLALEKRTTREFLPPAQQLYRWLIAPLEAELSALQISTVIFVPDGPLRTISMAALHDGERFLVEKYALAVTPGLALTDPRPIARERLKVLALGVTESVQGFPPLPNVAAEMEVLRTLFGSTNLVNEAFNVPAVERELKQQPFTILHIASHGEFGSDVKDTFLLTFDDRLTMDRLNDVVGLLKYRKEPLELLTLSACDTAAGDDRAALGLAGIAIKAGARSALATLWSVNDIASSGLVSEFYRQLRDPSVSRAAALQRAQTKMLSDPRYDHPGFWSAFLLINNWL